MTRSASENFVVKLILSGNSSEAEVRFVKNDTFREIPMFSLNVRPGNDRSIKQFLANEISRLKSENAQFYNSNNMLSEDNKRKGEELQKLTEKINEMKLIYQNRFNEMKNEHTNALSELNYNISKEKESIFKDSEVQRRVIEEEYKKQIKELNQKIDELTVENKQLREKNLSLENENHTLSQSQIQDLDKNQLQVLTLTQKVKDKEDMIQQLQTSLDDTKDRCRDLEKMTSSFEYEIQKVKDKYEEQSRQLQKANEIIVKLDATMRMNKQQFKEYKGKLIEREQVSKKLNDKISKLEAKLRSSKEKYMQQLNELSQVNSEQESHIEQLNQQIEQLEQQKTNLNSEQMRLQKAMYEMVKKSEQKEKEVAKYTSFASNFSPPPKSTAYTPSSTLGMRSNLGTTASTITTAGTALKPSTIYTPSTTVTKKKISLDSTDDTPYRPLFTADTYQTAATTTTATTASTTAVTTARTAPTTSTASDYLGSSNMMTSSRLDSQTLTAPSPKTILFNQASTPSKFSM